MAQERTYTADEIATAARELREAAGAGEEEFSKEQVISMLGDEINMLRERGFTYDQIAELCSGFDIDLTAAELALHSPKAPLIS
jgi:hypothetical protein